MRMSIVQQSHFVPGLTRFHRNEGRIIGVIGNWDERKEMCSWTGRTDDSIGRCLHAAFDTEGRVLESPASIDMVCLGLCDIAK